MMMKIHICIIYLFDFIKSLNGIHFCFSEVGIPTGKQQMLWKVTLALGSWVQWVSSERDRISGCTHTRWLTVCVCMCVDNACAASLLLFAWFGLNQQCWGQTFLAMLNSDWEREEQEDVKERGEEMNTAESDS